VPGSRGEVTAGDKAMLPNPGKNWLNKLLQARSALFFSILFLVSAAAFADQKEKVNWISFEQARYEATKTGKPIFIFFHFVWANYDTIFYVTFADPHFVDISREFLCVEVPVTWAKGGKYGKKTLAGMGSLEIYNPQHKSLYGAFLDPNGRVFDYKYLDCEDANQFGDFEPDRYTRLLRDILIRYSRGLGQSALKEKKYTIALNRFQVLLKYARQNQDKELAQAGIAQLEKIAAERLQQAKATIEAKKYLEAYEGLSSLKEDFPGLAVSKEAENQMAQLEADPVIKNEMERARLERKAAPLYQKALEYEELKEHDLAYMLYKSIADTYANCPTAERAAVRIKEIESDPLLMKTIKAKQQSREAKKLLDMAKNLEMNGFTE
jgi:hypothetical protein